MKKHATKPVLKKLKPIFKKITIEVAYCPICKIKLAESDDPGADYCQYQCINCGRTFWEDRETTW